MLKQVITVTYDDLAENPLTELDPEEFSRVRFYIDGLNPNPNNKAQTATDSLVGELFAGDMTQYLQERQKHTNVTDLFHGLEQIARDKHLELYPITKYDHTDITYSIGTTRGWDQGVAGFALANTQDVHLAGKTRQQIADKYITPMLEDLTDYVNGDIYYVAKYHLTSHHEISNDILDAVQIYAHQTDYTNIKALLRDTGIDDHPEHWLPAETRVTTAYWTKNDNNWIKKERIYMPQQTLNKYLTTNLNTHLKYFKARSYNDTSKVQHILLTGPRNNQVIIWIKDNQFNGFDFGNDDVNTTADAISVNELEMWRRLLKVVHDDVLIYQQLEHQE